MARRCKPLNKESKNRIIDRYSDSLQELFDTLEVSLELFLNNRDLSLGDIIAMKQDELDIGGPEDDDQSEY